MANRVLIGNRSTGGQGLYVSQHGDNVLTTTNAMQFDSRMGASAIVHSYGQGTRGPGTDTITHNLGYKPLFAVRWSGEDDISSGVATAAYTPAQLQNETEDYYGENYFGFKAGIIVDITTSTLTIQNKQNNYGGNSSISERDIYYAYVIFHQEDFTGGRGL